MKDIVLILVAGKSNTGKGEFSRRLEEVYKTKTNHNIIRCSLSTYIRELAKNDFYWDGIDTQLSRQFMAETYRLGTLLYPYHMARRVWERDIQPNIITSQTNVIIVESFREKNNYDYFKLLKDQHKITDIITINIVRPGYVVVKDSLLNHVSEIDLDDFEFDYTVINNEDISKIHNESLRIYNSIIMENFFKRYG